MRNLSDKPVAQPLSAPVPLHQRNNMETYLLITIIKAKDLNEALTVRTDVVNALQDGADTGLYPQDATIVEGLRLITSHK